MAEKQRSEEWFPVFARTSQVMIVAEDVLTSEVLVKALDLDEKIKAITVQNPDNISTSLTFEDVCFKAGPDCTQKSVLEAWLYNRELVEGAIKASIPSAVFDSL